MRLSAGVITTPGPDTGSVDSDDGQVDGQGSGGHSYRVPSGEDGLRVLFDARELGGLPTQVAVVWTDGSPDGFVRLEVFGLDGRMFGGGGAGPMGDGDLLGSVEDDAVFARDLGGVGTIAAIRLRTEAGPRGDMPMEIDHLHIGGLTSNALQVGVGG